MGRSSLGVLLVIVYLVTAPAAGWLALQCVPTTLGASWMPTGICGFTAAFCLYAAWTMMTAEPTRAE